MTPRGPVRHRTGTATRAGGVTRGVRERRMEERMRGTVFGAPVRTLALLAAFVLRAEAAHAASPAASDTLPAPRSAEDVARRVDERFYYPQAHGLEALRARVRVPVLDSLFAANGAAVPEIEFLWRAPDTRSFIVGPSDAQLLRAQVVRMLDGRGELVVPRPLAQTLARYENRSVEARGDTVVLTASTGDTTVDLRSLRLTVETRQWRLQRMEAATSRGTLVSENQFRQAEDLNVLSQMNVRFADIQARVRLDYARHEDLWLVSRIVYAVRGGSTGNGISEFEILLGSFRINESAHDPSGPR